MKRLLIITALVAGIGGFMLHGCATFGTSPKDLSRIEASPQYDPQTRRFDNPNPGVLQKVNEVTRDWRLMRDFFFVDGERTPDHALPQVRPDLRDFLAPAPEAKFIWLGHSSLLLRASGKNILIDPVFSNRASPVPFTVARFQDPVITLDELPDIDIVVISHDHYDHLDMETIKKFRKTTTRFLVPLGVGAHLRGWGIEQERITELDWWESSRQQDFTFVCTPAQHFSGRSLFNKNKTLWASWVIQDATHNIFFSGDSGYGDHFKRIGDRYGPFDIAFIENGQYNNRWRGVHMMPEESIQAHQDLRADMFVPIHWAMFELSLHTWYQPGMEISALACKNGVNISTPRIGQIVTVDGTPQGTAWWQPWVDPARPRERYAQKVN